MGNTCGPRKKRSTVTLAAESSHMVAIPWRRKQQPQSSVAVSSKCISLTSYGAAEVDEPLRNPNLRMLGSFRSGRSLRVVVRHSESMCSEQSLKSVSKGVSTRIKLDTQIAAKYNALYIIGRGSFSTVLSIEDKNNAVQYALKIVKKKKLHLPRNGGYTELDILRKLRHPNIIRLQEAYSTRNKIYLILELATGGDIYQRLLAVGSYKETAARAIVVMVLKALHYLHNIGITHRDVKMENCLFKSPDEDAPVLLSDFGLAHLRIREEDALMQTTCGTVEYLSPEVINGETYTSLVDMWSLGVITYAMLCGSVPFADNSIAATYNMIISGSYSMDAKDWREVSSEAKDFISGLLTVDTNKRWSTETALQSPWTNT